MDGQTDRHMMSAYAVLAYRRAIIKICNVLMSNVESEARMQACCEEWLEGKMEIVVLRAGLKEDRVEAVTG